MKESCTVLIDRLLVIMTSYLMSCHDRHRVRRNVIFNFYCVLYKKKREWEPHIQSGKAMITCHILNLIVILFIYIERESAVQELNVCLYKAVVGDCCFLFMYL